MARAKPGLKPRTSIPRHTGSSTIMKTSMVFLSCSPTVISPGWNQAIDRLTITGRVSTAITELIAVRLMLSATSPRNRWL
ncbi:hypothetical protein D3C71_1773720 [compost metagenome]